MPLQHLDLNLLPVFQQIWQQRSVSAAADALGMSQPAVSNALRRLRTTLGDELFTRGARGVVPTALARQLAEGLGPGLAQLEDALRQRQPFQAAQSDRRFQLAISDIGDMYFLPPLMQAFAASAPKLRLSTTRSASAAQLSEQLHSGDVDIAIGLLPGLGPGIAQELLFQQHYVCLYRQHHPAVQGPLQLEQFQQMEHLAVLSQGTGHEGIDRLIEQAGVQRKIRLQVPHFMAVAHLLQATDLIATVPERFAQRCVAMGLAYSPHPVPLPGFPVHLCWHRRYQRDAANLWLRQLILQLFADARA